MVKHLATPKLRRLRRERDLSLDTVSLLTGIHRTSISRKERRLAPLTEAELLKLAALYEVEPAELRAEEFPGHTRLPEAAP